MNNNEDIHYLGINNLKIIQDKNGFRFGMDAVLLSDFAKDIKKNMHVMDMCSGNGIISLLLSAKLSNPIITAVEIQEAVHELAKRNVAMNKLEPCIKNICMNLKDLPKTFLSNSFDAIVCNPPYKKFDSGIVNNLDTKKIARHEILCTLEDVISVSSFLLKPKSALYMVHRPERLSDIIYCLKKYNLEPKCLRFVQPYFDKEPNLLLIKAVKNAHSFIKVMKTLVIYDDNGQYTKEVLDIYGINSSIPPCKT